MMDSGRLSNMIRQPAPLFNPTDKGRILFDYSDIGYQCILEIAEMTRCKGYWFKIKPVVYVDMHVSNIRAIRNSPHVSAVATDGVELINRDMKVYNIPQDFVGTSMYTSSVWTSARNNRKNLDSETKLVIKYDTSSAFPFPLVGAFIRPRNPDGLNSLAAEILGRFTYSDVYAGMPISGAASGCQYFPISGGWLNGYNYELLYNTPGGLLIGTFLRGGTPHMSELRLISGNDGFLMRPLHWEGAVMTPRGPCCDVYVLRNMVVV